MLAHTASTRAWTLISGTHMVSWQLARWYLFPIVGLRLSVYTDGSVRC
jgi:hypothetical protein